MNTKLSKNIILTDDISLTPLTFSCVKAYSKLMKKWPEDLDYFNTGSNFICKKNTRGRIVSFLGFKFVNFEGAAYLIPLRRVKDKFIYM